VVIVRESSHPGSPCNILGPLVAEAPTRYFYQRRPGHIAFAMRSPRIHIMPCRHCPDHTLPPPWNGQDDD
jgi:hypothetical protein